MGRRHGLSNVPSVETNGKLHSLRSTCARTGTPAHALIVVHDVHREHLLVVLEHDPVTAAAAVPGIVRGPHVAAVPMGAFQRDRLRMQQPGARQEVARKCTEGRGRTKMI